MARSKKSEGKATFKRLDRIWNDVDQAAWATWLVEANIEGMWHIQGPHITGRCPFHEDKTASFKATPKRGMAFCFGCRRIYTNPVFFVAAVNKTSVAEALVFMRKRWGLSAALPKDLIERLSAHEAHQKKKEVMLAYFCDLLWDCFSSYSRGMLIQDGLGWAQAAIDYLLNRKLGENGARELVAADQVSDGTFDQYGVWAPVCSRRLLGIFPPISFVRNKFGDGSDEAKFFENYFADYTSGQTYIGHLVFPYDDTPTSVCRFKLREPVSPTKSQPWVDDPYKDMMDEFRGYYGLRYYLPFLVNSEHSGGANEKGYLAHVTEGEFDTLAALIQMIRRNEDDYISLGLSGAGAQSLNPIARFNIKQIRFLQDRDNGGIKFVKDVLDKTTEKALSFSVFRWPDEYVNFRDKDRPDARIKDADDAIRELGFPRWSRYVRNDGQMYAPINEWCYDQASAEINAAPSQDVAVVNRVGKVWGSLLRDEQICLAFCTALARDFEIDAAQLYKDLFVKDDDEMKFVVRLQTALNNIYHAIGVENAEGRKRVLQLWNKTTRETETVVLGDERSAETLVARHFGPIYDFVAATTGEPEFIVGDGEDSPKFNVTMRSKKYREALVNALMKVVKGLPSVDNAPVRGQGVHMVRHTEGHMLSYMVNGRDVYVLTHDGAGFSASRLDGPRHEDYIFDTTGKTWINTVKTPEDLHKQVDLVEIFHRIRDMINTGWKFKHAALDSTFLAAYVMSLAVMTVFTRQTAIMLNAEAQSGKSKFTSGFIGGTGYPSINVVAHALAMQVYTAAGIRQEHSNVSLCLCLEEFEDAGYNDKKTQIVKTVLEMLRDMISESGVKVTIGTATGASKSYHMRFPMATCAIRPLRDHASLSRFVRFDMATDATWGDPEANLAAKFGPEVMAQTRHDLFVGILPHMLTLRAHQAALSAEFAEPAVLPAHVTSRFREATIPVLCMLKLVGDIAIAMGRPDLAPNYRTFAYDFAESRRDQLAQLKTTTQEDQLFEAVVRSTFQITNIGDANALTGTTSVAKMLSELNALENINKTMKGAYIDIKMEWLVVNWAEAKMGVLAMTNMRNEPVTVLRDIATRSPHHIPPDEIKRARTLERLVYAMGPCVSRESVSVFSIKHMLDEIRARGDEAKAKPADPADPDKKDEAQAVDPNKAQGDDDIIA